MGDVVLYDCTTDNYFRSNEETLERIAKKVNDCLTRIGTWDNKEEYEALKRGLESHMLYGLDHYVETAQITVYREMYRNLGLPIPDDDYILWNHVYPDTFGW